MISFQLDWADWLSWLPVAVLIILLAGQVWLVWRNESLSVQRKAIRLVLNGLLWLLLVGYVLQPTWTGTTRSTHTLLVGREVPGEVSRRVSDSLNIREVSTERTFRADRYDSVMLVGQAFSPELLGRLSRLSVRWIPYYAPDQVQAIRWESIVQQGEMQRVTGVINSSKKQRIKLAYAGRTLDSLTLPKGFSRFTLQFPAFALGRTETELILNQITLDTIRFFARPTKPLTYQFILDTPDFESKTLADWLGRNGNSVQITATLSKNITNKLTINRAAAKPDVIVTDPANAANSLVKRALADGKAVLFINLTNPEVDCRLINKALGTRWQVRKVSNEPLVPVGNGLNALPYALAMNATQTDVPGYPVAVQQVAGRVGVSLLNETFPLKLSGDSLAYSRVWNSILARIRPSAGNNTELNAPVLSGFREVIHLNNIPNRPPAIRVGDDTVRLAYSPLNGLSAAGKVWVNRSGWLSVQDTLATFAEHSGFSTVRQSRLVQAYALAHATELAGQKTAPRRVDEKLPNWAWLALFIICLTILWVEPKLGG